MTIVGTGNDVTGMTDEPMEVSVVEGLKTTLRIAEKAGVTLWLEPLNSWHDHPRGLAPFERSTR